MGNGNNYLLQVIENYKARDSVKYFLQILKLKGILKERAAGCYIETLDSGSYAKGTAISLSSDLDYFISLTSGCNNGSGLKEIYESLFARLKNKYPPARKQNVSVRVTVEGLEIDITPGRKQAGNTNTHTIYLSKQNTRKQTNIQKHISDIKNSGRLNEIKILKIRKTLHNIEFPSIYLEYLLINNILYQRPKGDIYIENNFQYILECLAKDINNPLYSTIIDPANVNNNLSELLTVGEKKIIIAKAKEDSLKTSWSSIVY